jgi:hypothetical protein
MHPSATLLVSQRPTVRTQSSSSGNLHPTPTPPTSKSNSLMNFLTLCTYSSPFQQQSRRESLHPRPRPSSITLANTNNSHYPPPYNYVEYFSEANNFTLICGDTTSMSGCTLPSGQNPWNATIDVIANWGLNLHLSYFGFCSKFCHRVEDWPWIRFSIFGSSRVLIQDNMLGVVSRTLRAWTRR